MIQTGDAATHPAVTDASATALPTSEVVVAAHGGEAMCDVLASTPSGDTNHVLCRGRDEPLSDFSGRVEWRLRTLRRKSSIRRVCYLLGPHAPHDWLPSRHVMVSVLGLLGAGAVFELVAPARSRVDVVQLLDELMPHAKVGVRVCVRREGLPASLEDRATEHAREEPSGVHEIPGLASTKRGGAPEEALPLLPPPLWG